MEKIVRLSWIKDQPALVFVILALFFGVIFTFKFAPLNGTDEFTHFPRVYQISEGVLWEKRLPGQQFGGSLPNNVNAMINAYRNLSRESSGSTYELNKQQLNHQYETTSNPGTHQVEAIFTSVVTYPPWAYVAPLAGLLLAKLLHTPLLWYVYLSRLSSLLLWILLTWLAIKLIPRGKWFMVALALLPTSLTQAATIGADGLLNGLSWLIIAWTLGVLAKKLSLNWINLVLLSLAMILECIIKDGYFLIGLFPLVIPNRYFPTTRTGYIWRAAAIVLAGAAAIGLTLRTIRTVAGVILVPTVGINMNSQQQMHYLLHHLPLYLVHVLWQPFTKSFDTIYLGVVGIFTNRLIYLSIMTMFLLFFSLYLGLVNTKTIPTLLPLRKRLWITGLIVWIGTYVMLATAFYIGNTSVGAPIVNGLYGRYFLPFLPLGLILPMTVKRSTISAPYYRLIIILITIISLTATMASIG